ncbi:MAG: phospholipase D-like domain-containing protein, partial [Haloquadratum sp.]
MIVQRAVRVACVVLVLSASAPFAASAAPRGEPRIVAAVPDPVAAGDVGEYVVVDAAGARNLTLSDGERTVPIPPLPSPPRPPPRRRDDRGRRDLTALSTAPNATRSLLDASSGDRRTVRVVEADLRLANAGERLVLRRDGVVVDRLDYDGAREGARLNATTGRWVPRGLRLRPVVATGPAEATAFVLPDAPGVPLETLRDADERILLAGYTFASARVTAALLAAAERGVRVRVLLEGGPIGGMTTTQREHLDRLVAGGVEVRLLVGPHDRFAYHHAKYAVVDETALVLTENW